MTFVDGRIDSPPAPQAAQSSRGPGAFALLAVAVLGAVGIWLNLELSLRGTTVDGVVMSHRVVPDLSDAKDDTYSLTYRFTDETGRTHDAEAVVDHVTWMATPDGDRVGVTYLPENPAVSRLAIRWTDLVVPGLLGLGVVVAGIAGVILALRAPRRRPRRRKRRT